MPSKVRENMMKNKLTDLIVLILFLSLSVHAQPLTANNLENIEITKAGDSVLVKITTSDAAEYNAFLTEEKPERIVVDLAGVTNDFKTEQNGSVTYTITDAQGNTLAQNSFAVTLAAGTTATSGPTAACSSPSTAVWAGTSGRNTPRNPARSGTWAPPRPTT